ncbi:Uncharacterised protein [Mycobacteroides abscessus subsp. abscessus]|nr:Uncharacterised protein [Mycobacteroides abscessus subsp. abscessus]SKU91593.1 Uncharacterised protein [Mycobacteroides abscessus subsp. abscessus]
MGHASPATTNVRLFNPSGDNMPTADGVWNSTVTFSRINRSRKSSGERTTESGMITNLPPCNSAPKISQTVMSKTRDPAWVQTSPGPVGIWVSGNLSACVTLLCAMATPLGTPVVPEV